MTFRHKYKIGDKVIVEGKLGTIFTLGHAETKGRRFNTCSPGTETDNQELIGYQVHFGNKVKIIKESDIKPA